MEAIETLLTADSCATLWTMIDNVCVYYCIWKLVSRVQVKVRNRINRPLFILLFQVSFLGMKAWSGYQFCSVAVCVNPI